MTVAFGNDPAKIDRYRAFWDRAPVARPLVGFSLIGWFPVQEFAACRAWRSLDSITPDMIDPDAFLEDHLRMLREGEAIEDDMIRGACPGQVAIPWLPGVAGCKMRVLPDSAKSLHLPQHPLGLRADAREPNILFIAIEGGRSDALHHLFQ